ncbi:MAG: Bacterial antitoxin of type system, VapB [Thermomicrobiales bacterium]|nr:Bacterial antitoxin of type system, VapB [Thermomicrobiales bacterium]
MCATSAYYVRMIKRTTIEIDQQLLERAKQALDCPTTRATVEEALRRAAEQAETEFEERAARQREYFDLLPTWADLDVLASDEMWR